MPFNPGLAGYILDEMSKGQRSVRSICSEQGLPDRGTVFGWVLDNPEFARQFMRARELQQHSFADDIIWISDTETDQGKARTQIDARKWTASRLLPKVYGDHINHEHTGYVQSGNAELIQKLTPEERDIVRGILLAAAAREAKDEAIEGQAKRIG